MLFVHIAQRKRVGQELIQVGDTLSADILGQGDWQLDQGAVRMKLVRHRSSPYRVRRCFSRTQARWAIITIQRRGTDRSEPRNSTRAVSSLRELSARAASNQQ